MFQVFGIKRAPINKPELYIKTVNIIQVSAYCPLIKQLDRLDREIKSLSRNIDVPLLVKTAKHNTGNNTHAYYANIGLD